MSAANCTFRVIFDLFDRFPRSPVGIQTHRSAVTAPPRMPNSRFFPMHRREQQPSSAVYSDVVPVSQAGSTAERWDGHSHGGPWERSKSRRTTPRPH